MLLAHCIRRADSRANCTAGNRSATRMPMMAITTSNSTSVKPDRNLRDRMRDMVHSLKNDENNKDKRHEHDLARRRAQRLVALGNRTHGALEAALANSPQATRAASRR